MKKVEETVGIFTGNYDNSWMFSSIGYGGGHD